MSDQKDKDTNGDKAEALSRMGRQDRGTKNVAANKDMSVIITPGYQMKHNYVLAIAVDRYEDEDIPNLNNCLNDIEDVLEVLTNDYFFSKDNIHYLRSRREGGEDAPVKAKEEALAAHIDEASHEIIIEKLKYFARNMTPKDNLLICFSGHGIYDKDFDEGYWIPADGKQGSNASYIENATIRTALNAIDTHHTVLISDSCYSGTLFSTNQSRALEVPRVYAHASRWGITAGRMEPVSDGALGDNSPFAKELLDILREKREIWIADLINTIIKRVADENDEKQTPVGEALALINGHQNGQFVFFPKKVSEIDYWRDAWRENTRKAYYNFLARYPDGEFEEVALAALNTFAADKKPLVNEEIMYTYAFLKAKISPDFAKAELKLFCSSSVREEEMKPLIPSVEEAYSYLKQHLSEDTAVRYLKSFLHDSVFDEKDKKTELKPAEQLDESVRVTYHYLLERDEDLAADYLAAFAFGKTAIILSSEVRKIIVYLEKYAYKYLKGDVRKYFVQGRVTSLFSQEHIATHSYLVEHEPTYAAQYFINHFDKTKIKVLSKNDITTHTFLREEEEAYADLWSRNEKPSEEYIRFLLNHRIDRLSRPLDQKEKATYRALKKDLPNLAEEAFMLYLSYVGKMYSDLYEDNHREEIKKIADAFTDIAKQNIPLASDFLRPFLRREEDLTLFNKKAAQAFLLLDQAHPANSEQVYPNIKQLYLSAFCCLPSYRQKVRHLGGTGVMVYNFLNSKMPDVAHNFIAAFFYKEMEGKEDETKAFFAIHDSYRTHAPELADYFLGHCFTQFLATKDTIRDYLKAYGALLEKDSSEEAKTAIKLVLYGFKDRRGVVTPVELTARIEKAKQDKP